MTDDPYRRLRRKARWPGAPQQEPEPTPQTAEWSPRSARGPRRIEVEQTERMDTAAHRRVEDGTAAAPVVPLQPEMGANAERIDALLNALQHQQELTRAEMVRAKHAELELEKAKGRIEREAARSLEQAKRGMLLGFLDVVDNLDRAISSAKDASSADAVVEGIELVRKTFHRTLADHGVKHRPSLGQRFDPALHEAIGMVPINDPSRDGEIVAVVREGYDVAGDVLRPASVAVAKSS